jgi:hypothetical protein
VFWAIYVDQLVGSTTWAISFLALLPLAGMYGAHTYRSNLIWMYICFLVVSIAGRIFLSIYMTAFFWLWTVLIVILDVYLLRTTILCTKVLAACTNAEIHELRAARAEGRLPMPDPAATHRDAFLAV